MSNRGIDAPLAVQMDCLKKNMQKRDKRRDQDRQQRLVSAAGDDPYAQSTRARSNGGVKLGPGAAAQAAVLNAAALQGPTPIRCDLCEANFRNEAMLRQHEEGPAHRKAVAKDKARREREAWMENPSAAANALQAAVWLNGDGALRQHATGNGGKGQQRYQKQSQGRGAPAGNQAEELVRSQGPTHADLIAKARRVKEPISIDGWVPPSLEGAAPALSEQDEASKDGQPEEGNPLHQDETASQESAEELAVQHQEAATGDAEGIGAGLVAYGESSEEEDSDSGSEKPMRNFESFF